MPEDNKKNEQQPPQKPNDPDYRPEIGGDRRAPERPSEDKGRERKVT